MASRGFHRVVTGQSAAEEQPQVDEIDDEELVVPLVLWNEPPKIQVACLHVLHLPKSLPSSQNVTTPNAKLFQQPKAKYKGAEDDQDEEQEDKYEVCVFVGTIDGLVVYWRFDRGSDQVAQVNLLVPGESQSQSHIVANYSSSSSSSSNQDYERDIRPGRVNSAIQAIVSGIDEWGQSMMVALGRQGALTKWQLPNGMCCFASSDLAKQLAPLKGMEMFCNRRFAMVFGEESRMMALDTWKMQLLYCVDTAQEQVRRSIAVAELQFGWGGCSLATTSSSSCSHSSSSLASMTVSSSSSSSSSSTATANDGTMTSSLSGTNSGMSSAPTRPSSFTSLATSHAKTVASSSINALSSVSASTSVGSHAVANAGPGLTSTSSSLVWDSLVISLGAEGLLKCFLWAKPRGNQVANNNYTTLSCATTVPTTSAVSSSSNNFHWRLASCWIISWADDTEDITCSQSTSLHNGDNMNPQTALMRSIKSSYFPIAIKISPDASLILFIWRTRWAVLRRKWFCDIAAASKQTAVHKAQEVPGTCRIHPATLVGQHESNSDNDKNPDEEDPDASGVCWVGGNFLVESELLLWTNTGHVFQFSLCHSQLPLTPRGQLFIFTKDEDQLVPRSFLKTLYTIKSVQYLAYLKQCMCCSASNKKKNSWLSLLETTEQPLHRDGVRWNSSGFTSSVMLSLDVFGSTTNSSNDNSNGSSEGNQLRLVHACRHGSVGCWQKVFPFGLGSKSRRKSHGASFSFGNVELYDRIKFHSLLPPSAFTSRTDSSKALSEALKSPRPEHPSTSSRLSVSHLMIGREQFPASWSMDCEDSISSGRSIASVNHPPVTLLPWKSSYPNANFDRNIKTTTATLPDPILVNTNSSLQSMLMASPTLPGSTDSEVFRHLSDVPVLVRGFGDGRLEFHLIQNGANANDGLVSTIHGCHHGPITCIAHCNWRTKRIAKQEDLRNPGSSVNPTKRKSNDGLLNFKTMPSPLPSKQMTWKRVSSATDSCLNHERNMFYRTGGVGIRMTRRTRHSRNHLQFLVFSGGKDGSMSIVQVLLSHAANKLSTSTSIYQCRSRLLQRFQLHHGQIQQITLSPWSELFRDHLVACIGADRRVTVFAPRLHSASRSMSLGSGGMAEKRGRRSPVEWECILELGEHADDVIGLTWQLDTGGFLLVECANYMTYVWNAETGILERCIPSRLLANNESRVKSASERSSSSRECARVQRFPVETCTIPVADSSIQLFQFAVHRGADHLKTTWKNFYDALRKLEDADASAVKQQQQPEDAKAIENEAIEKDLDVDADLESDDDQASEENDQDGVESTTGNDESHTSVESSLSTARSDVNMPKENDPLESIQLSSSPYATGSIELNMLSFLLNWGSDKEVDGLCQSLLGITRPKWSFSGALLGASNSLTIPIPWMAPKGSPQAQLWQHSAALTANIALSVVSLCMNLMEYRSSSTDRLATPGEAVTPLSPPNKQEFRSLWSRLVTQHSVYIPEHLVNYREASLESLARYGFHRNEHTQLASQLLLNGVIMRLAPTLRSVVTAEYCAKLHFEMARLESELGVKFSSSGTIDASILVKRVGPLVILLSIIGTCFPGEISPAGAREVCDILVFLLHASSHVASVAAELLAKGLMLFRPHLVDLSSLICQLLVLEVNAKQQQKNPGCLTNASTVSSRAQSDGSSFFHEDVIAARKRSNAALDLLVELGACEAAFVLTLLQQEINNADRSQIFRECVLVYLTELVNTHYLLMFRHLPAVVDTVMCCLDPTKPERRKKCLELSTLCLHNLVRKFPMIDFHRDSQRLALGTMEAVILIYDLRTATKWRVLDGHTSAISALCFRTDGQILVSYAAREASVRWWNSGSTGLFGGMLKMQQSCIKEQKLNVLKCQHAPSGNSVITSSSSSGSNPSGFDLKQVIQTCRFQFLIFKEKVSQKESTVLRLTREDASQVQFQL